MWFYSFLSLFIATSISLFSPKEFNSLSIKSASNENTISLKERNNVIISKKYEELGFSDLSFEAFKEAYIGYNYLLLNHKLANSRYLTVIDFGMPSNKKRLYLIDLENMEVVHQTYCAHGRNTGKLHATDFSNKEGSYKSSLGFYITKNTYKGKFDLGLRLEGVEKFNCNAMKRAIVMHGAEYATEAFLQKNNGVLGRSLGCPALPMEEAPEVIHRIKDGSCMYIYHPKNNYRASSALLKDDSINLEQHI